MRRSDIVINTAGFSISKSFIDQAHAAGLLVHGWTFAQADPTLAAAEYKRPACSPWIVTLCLDAACETEQVAAFVRSAGR